MVDQKILTFFKSPHYHLMVYICVYDIKTANIPTHHSNENINTSVCINENKNNNIFLSRLMETDHSLYWLTLFQIH